MSMDSSLKSGTGLAKHRNVLSRAERIARLVERDKFDPRPPHVDDAHVHAVGARAGHQSRHAEGRLGPQSGQNVTQARAPDAGATTGRRTSAASLCTIYGHRTSIGP